MNVEKGCKHFVLDYIFILLHKRLELRIDHKPVSDHRQKILA